MRGMTVLVTGATDGIGRQTALELAQLGARVIVHGRSAERVEPVVRELGRAHKRGRFDSAVADLAAPDQIRAMAADVIARFGQLDVLINNAGIFAKARTLTPEGHELTFMVNHLAPVLLTHQLLPALRAAAPARVVNVSSMVHNGAPLDFDNLAGQKRFDGYAAYAMSKLANVLFTLSLADRIAPDELGAFALHPGVIDTKLLRSGFGMGGADLASGARTSVYAATSRELDGLTGRYLQDGRGVPTSSATRNKETRDRMWAVSTQLLGIDWA